MKNLNKLLILSLILGAFFACEHEPLVEEGPEGGNPFLPPVILPIDTCDPDTIYFQNTILPLLQSNCTFSGCHGTGSPNLDKFNPATYTTIINSDVIDINDPTDSDIYDVITENDPDKRMPRPPYDPLSAGEIQLILDWISQGAKNNSCEDCDTSNYSFSMDIYPIIEKTCQGGCHAGSTPLSGFLLTTHAEIKAKAVTGQLYGAISHDPNYSNMPKNLPKLPQCKIDQIKNWIDNGAPND